MFIAMEAVYLKEELSNELEKYRKIIRSALAQWAVKEDGSIAGYMSNASLDTLVLNFALNEISQSREVYELFLQNFKSKEINSPLVKEYYFGNTLIGSKLQEISKKYAKDTKRFFYPKASVLIRAAFQTLFSRDRILDLTLYIGIFSYISEKRILTETALDFIMGKEGLIIDSEDKRELSSIIKNIQAGFRFVNDGTVFAVNMLKRSSEIMNNALAILKDIYHGSIDNVVDLRNRFLKIIKKLEVPFPSLGNSDYDESVVISELINRIFEIVSNLEYAKDPAYVVIGPDKSKLIQRLRAEGIDIEIINDFMNNSLVKSITQSLIGIVLNAMLKDKYEKLTVPSLESEVRINLSAG